MDRLTSGLSTEDLEKVKFAVHALQSTAGYAGAGHIYYTCYYMDAGISAKNTQGILEYYPLLVEAVIDFKRFSRKFLSECKGKVKCCFQIFILTDLLIVGELYRET